MQRNYLSLAQSRAWSLDYPIGDPFGGAPYGQRAMPVVAVAAAAASVSMGVGMIAAAGGLAAMSIGSALVAGALVAGGALSIVGTVTGNQKLAKIGGTLQLVGGVGAFAQGAANAWGQAAADASLGSKVGAAVKGGVGYMGEMTSKGFSTISDSFGNFIGGDTIATNTSGATEAQRLQAVDVGAANMERASIDAYNAQQAAIGGGGEVTGAMLEPPAVPSSNLAQYNQAVAPTAGPSATGGGAPQVGGGAAKGGGFLGTGMTTGEAVTVAGLGASAMGSWKNAEAQEAATEWNKAEQAKKEANMNYVPWIINSEAQYDALSPKQKADVMLFKPKLLTPQASTAVAPTTTAQNYTIAPGSAVLGAVQTVA